MGRLFAACLQQPPKAMRLVLALVFLCVALASAGARLHELTASTAKLQANQAVLLKDYCPTGAKKCDEDPATVIDISTIGGILFATCVGICVGTDVTWDGLVSVVKHSKRGFAVGMLSQFGFMPFYAFVFSYIFKDDLTNSAFYSYEATVLGMTIVGCLPGGNTSNLFTWFTGGNVPLSILMSLVSNVFAFGMMPLLLYVYFEQRFAGSDVPDVPYMEIVIPMAVTIAGVASGMVIKAKASAETIWWVAKLSSLVGLFFLFAAVAIGLMKYPHLLAETSISQLLFCLSMQPAGYVAGWGLGTLFRCGLKDKLTIAFETGVQSFTLGLVMAQLGFNAEKEACQFDDQCMRLIGNDLDKYQFSWDADGRIKEGSKVGQITMQGFLPGQAGERETGGCCRYNELIYTDVFKFSALCSLFYSIHAFWMVKLLRKIFPGGYVRNKDVWKEEKGEPSYKRGRVIFPDGKLEPAFAAEGLGSAEVTPAVTLIQLMGKAAARVGGEWALAVESPCEPFNKEKKRHASKPWNEWKRWTWDQYVVSVQEAAQAFAHLGLKQYGAVSIYGFNTPEWHISCLAAMLVGGKACGIYPTDTLDQVTYKVEHSDSSIAVIEDSKKLKYFAQAAAKDGMLCLKAIIMYGETPEQTQLARKDDALAVYAWAQVGELSRNSGLNFSIPRPSKNGGQIVDSSGTPEISASSPAVLVYTSGTTGMPKAVMLSHDNLCFMARTMLYPGHNRIGVEFCQERVLSYLPLSHVAGMMADIIVPISTTALTRSFVCCYFARNYDLKEGTLKDRLTFVRPTYFFGVPRVWEKFHEGLKAAGKRMAELRGLKAQMPICCCFKKTTVARWAKNQGMQSALNLQFGRSGKTTSYLAMADAAILSKIRAALGLDCCKLCMTGAAPIMQETLEAFGSYGLTILEGYGMSESSAAVSSCSNERYSWGCCGYALPGVQIRIFRYQDAKNKTECPKANDPYNPSDEEQGEICFRGRNIMMGYYANPNFGDDHVNEMKQKTEESIDEEGWLRSGDMGCVGENGFLRITGRYKELIITAGGENIAPVPIEDNVKRCCDALSNVVMIGDKRKFNTCLVTLKVKEDGTRLSDQALLVAGISTLLEARQSAEYRKVIEAAITATNTNSKVCPSNASKIQKFDILPQDFSVDGEELTPTLKLKRKVIEAKYKDVIEALYNGGGGAAAAAAPKDQTVVVAPASTTPR